MNAQKCIVKIEDAEQIKEQADFALRGGLEVKFPIPPIVIRFEVFDLPDLGDELRVTTPKGGVTAIRIIKRTFFVLSGAMADEVAVELEGTPIPN